MAINHRELVVQVRTQNPRKTKNALTTANPPVAYQAKSRTGAEDVLLPPLRPPNDPEMMEEQNKRKRDQERRKLAMQKKNAEDVLLKYSVDPQKVSERREGRRLLKVTESSIIWQSWRQRKEAQNILKWWKHHSHEYVTALLTRSPDERKADNIWHGTRSLFALCQ